jgi:hypothetical protein
MVLAQNKNEDQSDRIEDPDMTPHSYAQLIFDSHQKYMMEKDNLVNKCCWEKLLSTCRKLKLDPCLSPYTIINSNWIKYLNIRPETLPLVQERSGIQWKQYIQARNSSVQLQQTSN